MTESAKPDAATRKKQRRSWYAELVRLLPKGVTPLEAVAAVKCLDETGNLILVPLKTRCLSSWEAYGMAAYLQDEYSVVTIDARTEDDD